MTPDLHRLPPGLPAPVDDGACDHRPGASPPAIALPSTAGRSVRLDQVARGRAVLLFYHPGPGEPGAPAGPERDRPLGTAPREVKLA